MEDQGNPQPPEPTEDAKLTTCTACGREISRNAAACPHCGEPGVLQQMNVAADNDDGGEEKPGCRKIGCWLLILVFGVITLIGMYIERRDKKAGNYDYSVMAKIQCENYVKEILKSPASAKFPTFDYNASRVEQVYTVTSYVDSQNSFGALIRTNWICKIKYLAGDEASSRSWELLDFQHSP